MRSALLLAFLLCATSASAQIYRWVDEKGTVHYSNSSPPNGVQATVFDREAKAGPPSPDSAECYTVRCQGERLEQRLARREQLESRAYAERIAATPRPPRGLEFRKYMWLERGMSEGEFLTIAGAPDILTHEGWDGGRSYIYMPTPGDPFVTTVVISGGRIRGIERVRKF